MKREDLLRKEAYWVSKIQIDLFSQIEKYMIQHQLNRTRLSEKLGVTKGYITQVLNGSFDHKLSKLVSLAMAIGKVPRVEFVDLESFIHEDKKGFQTITKKVTIRGLEMFGEPLLEGMGSTGKKNLEYSLGKKGETYHTAFEEHNPLVFSVS